MKLKFHPKAAVTAGLLAGHGLRKGSLSASGSAAALLVGYGHLANDDPKFGIAMIVFYAIGTAATKYKANIKASLEDGHGDQTAAAGKRTAWQVLCNSTPSLISAVLYKFLLTSEASVTLRETCIPILLTTFKPCPPGTNGGISLFGTGMSIVGGSIIGVTVSILQTQFGTLRGVGATTFIGAGALAGFAGSMLDSLLGATLQQTLYDTDKKKILLDDAVARQRKLVRTGSASNHVISGLEVLTNNQVNFVSSATIAIISGLFGVYVL
ncbi:hypothetical protein QFC21_001065 [Naganishia friedmannii]|uniref:Uncharacterized protein n=1 Tax=Naganishia friedmannii TaxID=89922 RepID=A0ACC2W9T6_9TREE|nr:hypothetical protein QFC21_001065 [Naganishia friedmannii]